VPNAYGLALEPRPDPFGSDCRETAADHDLVAVTVATLLEQLSTADGLALIPRRSGRGSASAAPAVPVRRATMTRGYAATVAGGDQRAALCGSRASWARATAIRPDDGACAV
jgi:hypothetical protein